MIFYINKQNEKKKSFISTDIQDNYLNVCFFMTVQYFFSLLLWTVA